MNRLHLRSSLSPFFALVLTTTYAFPLAGCTAQTGAESTPSAAESQTSHDTVIAARGGDPLAAYYVIHADGSGEVRGSDGTKSATFRSRVSSNESTLRIDRNGATYDVTYSVERGEADETVVRGIANGQAFTIRVHDGVAEGSVPDIENTEIARIARAMSSDLSSQLNAHDRFGCAAVGVLAGVGVATANLLVIGAAMWLSGECL